MPDPIEQLSNFEPGVPMSPMSPGEIRRRGERRRRRNAVLAVGGAAAAVLLVAVPLAVLGGEDDGDGGTPQPAQQPISTKDLLTADELPVRDRLTPWEETMPDGQLLACAPAPPASLDETNGYRRDFRADIAGAPADEIPSSVIRTGVLQFDDAAEARAAYDRAQGWLFGCPGGDQLARKGVSVTEYELADGVGEWRLHEFYAPDICTECDAIRFDRMGIAQFGDRMVVLSLAEVGGPLEPEGLDASMQELFEAAVAKAGGEITGVSGSDQGPPPTDSLDFPIDHDAIDLTGDGGKILGPGPHAPGLGELSPCDRRVWPRPGDERLAFNSTGPEFGEARELVVFPTADEPNVVMEDLREALDLCPTEINEFDPTSEQEMAWDLLPAPGTGYDTVTFAQTYSDGMPGGTVWQFTRVGRAIFAISTDGEYTLDSAKLAVDRLTDLTRFLTQRMCEYTEEGC